AADRLIVGGCMPGNRNEVRPLSWYDMILKGLENSGLHMQNVPPPDGVVKRYSRLEDAQPEAGVAAAPDAVAPVDLPPWLRQSSPAEPRQMNFLRPSDPADDDHGIRPGESDADRTRARQRGTLVHRLLQSLPDVAAELRSDAAKRYLARNTEKWSDADRTALAAQVLGLIDDARFAAVFAPGSRAEVSIVGRLKRRGQPLLVSGQIDRLVVTPSEVWIVDYKTNHAPPRTLAEAPDAYVRQLALYRAVLAKLYPHRTIRAALLWTETPEIMELSPTALDAALSGIISP
ncbi:MAG: double-strand break repair helicase AddA, partial [Tardiphaga sp.]|uniref:PD-(D/E)XK nuclease family protein n=1 Tax=Tardiphaga sp. TaxID=1926292 RepID=UPI00263003D9